jgi:hypothetical protein
VHYTKPNYEAFCETEGKLLEDRIQPMLVRGLSEPLAWKNFGYFTTTSSAPLTSLSSSVNGSYKVGYYFIA